MRKVLVTGGAGFVGRRLVKRLLTSGDEVHCVDNLAPLSGAVKPGPDWFGIDPTDSKNFHFHEEDCREYFRRVKDDDFDLCFHLAAIVGGRRLVGSASGEGWKRLIDASASFLRTRGSWKLVRSGQDLIQLACRFPDSDT